MTSYWNWVIAFGMFSTLGTMAAVILALFFQFKPLPRFLPMQAAVLFGAEFVRLGGVLHGSVCRLTASREWYIQAYAPHGVSCSQIPWCYDGYRVRVMRTEPARFASRC